MYFLKNIDRILYQSDDNCNVFYPIILDEDFTYMAIESVAHNSYVMCFLYFRGMGADHYLDIYVWDNMLTEGYKRFVIQQGFSLAEGVEEVFLEYLNRDDILVEDASYKYCVNRIREEYPEIHLQDYTDWRQTLLHAYYTLHKSGPYEILFKANLNFLATRLGCINEYNLIGTSPEKILGVQLGMLRAMNSLFGSEVLETVENREWASYLYSKHHNLIHNSVVNKYQWKYLKEQEECGDAVKKETYLFLGKITSDEEYYAYLKYTEQKQIVDDYYSLLPQFPDEREGYDSLEVCDMIEWYIEHEYGINKRLCDKVRRYQNTYAYETSEYIVLMPASLRELLREAENQHNCLYQYVLEAACDNETFILFVRGKGSEKDSLITVEVHNEMINQAYGAYNRNLNEKEKCFLEEYAVVKKLILPHQYDYNDGDDEWEGEDED